MGVWVAQCALRECAGVGLWSIPAIVEAVPGSEDVHHNRRSVSMPSPGNVAEGVGEDVQFPGNWADA